MNLKLETEFSKAPILQEVDDLKRQIDVMRPLPADVEGKVMQKLRLDWNYHSNAIEGNRLNYGETVAFLMEGITAKGKPLKDHLDIRGHNEAINFLLSIVKDTRPISEADIRALHKMILVEPYDVKAQTADGLPTTKRITLGEYKTLPNHVQTATGEIHYYATPEETPAKMQEVMDWYAVVNATNEIHPVVAAALFHHKFVSIHPFDDGNGRLSRILMNLILMQAGYPPVIIKLDDRTNYYALLSRADNGDNWAFIEYIAEALIGSLNLYLKAANGGDVDEDEDIDKEIALLHMQLDRNIRVRDKRSQSSVERIFEANIIPLSKRIIQKLDGFNAFFYSSSNFFNFSVPTILGNFPSSFKIDKDSLESFKKTTSFGHNIPLEINISIKFVEYKDTNNKFDLGIKTKIILEEYQYCVLTDDEIIVSKPYHQDLTKIDQNLVIKKVIQYFKKQLEEKLKAPNHN